MSSRLLPLLAAVLFVLPSQSARAAEPTAPTPIIGGERVIGKRWSSTVALTYPKGGSNYRIQGSGVLVSPTVVLTAAHCLDDFPEPELIRVHLGGGKDGADLKGQYGVLATGIHPLYRLREFETDDGRIAGSANDTFDFAYLVLDRPVPAALVDIHPPLHDTAEISQLLVPGRDMTLVGYGRREVGTTTKIGFKNELTTPLQGVVGGTEIRFKGRHDRTILPGDSGGPALGQLEDGSWRVVGICSRGNSAAGLSTYGLVPFVVDWLQWDTAAEFGIPDDELALDPEWANEYFQEAKYLLRRGARGPAEAKLLKVVRLTPENPEARAELARFYMEEERHEEALEHATVAAEGDPFQFAKTLGRVQLASGRFAEAAETLALALEIDAEDREIHELRLQALEALGAGGELASATEALDSLDRDLLPASGIDPTQDPEELMAAVRLGDIETVRTLIRKGTDPCGFSRWEGYDPETSDRLTSFEEAARLGHLDLARLLLANGLINRKRRFYDSEYGSYRVAQSSLARICELPPNISPIGFPYDRPRTEVKYEGEAYSRGPATWEEILDFMMEHGSVPKDAVLQRADGWFSGAWGSDIEVGLHPNLSDEQALQLLRRISETWNNDFFLGLWALDHDRDDESWTDNLMVAEATGHAVFDDSAGKYRRLGMRRETVGWLIRRCPKDSLERYRGDLQSAARYHDYQGYIHDALFLKNELAKRGVEIAIKK